MQPGDAEARGAEPEGALGNMIGNSIADGAPELMLDRHGRRAREGGQMGIGMRIGMRRRRLHAHTSSPPGSANTSQAGSSRTDVITGSHSHGAM